MRVLILGGTRFIGPHVVRELAARGHELTLFHRGQSHAELPPAVRHVHGDLRELDRHADALRRLAPEVVLDMVALRAEDGRRVRAFEGVARRAVVVSSGDVYRAYGRLCRTEPGAPDPTPLTEDAPLRERLSPAGLDHDKTSVEREARGGALPVTILRLPAVFGPGDYQHRLFAYLKRMDDGRPFVLLDEAAARWRWSRSYVEDVAAAVALAVTDERAAGRVYNVSDAAPLSEQAWVERLARIVGWRGEVVTLPRDELPEAARMDLDFGQDLVLDSARLRAELDWREAVPLDEALRRTIAWERANPPAPDPAQDYGAEDAAVAHRRAAR